MTKTPEEIQADIERQREELAETVDQLGHKLDVKAQTKAKVDDVKVQTKAKVARRQGAEHHRRGQAPSGGSRRCCRRGRRHRAPRLAATATMSTQEAQQGEGRGEDRTEPTTPDPDDSRKPAGPADLTKRSWFYVLRKTIHEFTEDQCTDLAAALTYYAVLAVFPATHRAGLVARRHSARPRSVDNRHRHPQAAGLRRHAPETIEKALNRIADAPSAAGRARARNPGWPCGPPPGTSARSAVR